MRLLARLILSLEKLAKNPVKWFDEKPWLFRLFLTFLLIPLTSAVSIFAYQQMISGGDTISKQDLQQLSEKIDALSSDLENYRNASSEEISYISSDLGEFKKYLLEKGEVAPSDLVLGVSQDQIQKNLKERIDSIDINLKDEDLLYIQIDAENVQVFSEPSERSTLVDKVETGSFYRVLDQQGQWYEIDLGDELSGWVEKKNVSSFPINEKN